MKLVTACQTRGQLKYTSYVNESIQILYRLLDDAESCSRRSNDVFDKMTDAIAVLESEPTRFPYRYLCNDLCSKVPGAEPTELLQELKHLDVLLREEVQLITEIKVREMFSWLLQLTAKFGTECIYRTMHHRAP